MKYFSKIAVALWVAVVVFLSLMPQIGSISCSSVLAAQSIKTKVNRVDNDGNLVLNVSSKSIKKKGFSKKDIVSVTIGSSRDAYLMPINDGKMVWGSTYLDITGSNCRICRMNRNFAKREGLQNANGTSVRISLIRKKAYKWQMQTGNIADYGFNRYTFANFRCVQNGNISENKLYRSYSPISESRSYGGRSAVVNELMKENGIRTVITCNLDDIDIIKDVQTGGTTYYRELYKAGQVSAHRFVGTDISDEKTKRAIGLHMKFIANNEGPYLVHCAIGRDRTGFIICLLEALLGATYEEITEDYVQSFRNYNKVSPIVAKCLKSNVDDDIEEMIGDTRQYISPSRVDLRAVARKYMIKELKLSEEEINQIITNLS